MYDLQVVSSAKLKSNLWEITVDKKVRRRHLEPELSGLEEILCVTKSFLDRLQTEIQTSFKHHKDLNLKSGFFADIESLMNNDNLDIIQTSCNNFGQFYGTDVANDDLFDVTVNCKELHCRDNTQITTIMEFLILIIQHNEDVYPNLSPAH